MQKIRNVTVLGFYIQLANSLSLNSASIQIEKLLSCLFEVVLCIKWSAAEFSYCIYTTLYVIYSNNNHNYLTLYYHRISISRKVIYYLLLFRSNIYVYNFTGVVSVFERGECNIFDRSIIKPKKNSSLTITLYYITIAFLSQYK